MIVTAPLYGRLVKDLAWTSYRRCAKTLYRRHVKGVVWTLHKRCITDAVQTSFKRRGLQLLFEVIRLLGYLNQRLNNVVPQTVVLYLNQRRVGASTKAQR